MLSLRFGWLACVAGAALAVGASGSVLAAAPDSSCPDGTVCLFADKDQGGKNKTYFCDRGQRGTRSWDLRPDFPPKPARESAKGVSSYISYVRRAAFWNGTKLEVLKRGPRELLGSDNDDQTDLIIDCGVARDDACESSAPGRFGFSCELTRRGRSRVVGVTFDGAKRGEMTLTRTGGATTARLCDLALKDGHPGPLVRVGTGTIGEYRVAEGQRCATHRIPAQVRKFKVWWQARSTAWFRW